MTLQGKEQARNELKDTCHAPPCQGSLQKFKWVVPSLLLPLPLAAFELATATRAANEPHFG